MSYRDYVTKWNRESDLSGQQALFERFLFHHKNGIVPDEAVAYLLRNVAEKRFFSVQLMREYQTLASRNAYSVRDALREGFSVPGAFKNEENGGCAPEDCEVLVSDFIQEVSSFGTNNPLFYSAYLIADLCSFRPFPYANLETALLLVNHYLLLHQMAPLYVPESKRDSVMDAIRRYSEKETLSPLRTLLQELASETETLLF